MILDTQQAIHRVKKLPFCYLCGEKLSDPRNDDHVPPTSIFLLDDRNFPLILPTHRKCNGDRSAEDELIGQLFNILHQKAPNPKSRKLNVKAVKLSDGKLCASVHSLNIPAIIRRWVRGFNAALYKEFLPETAMIMTSTPMQTADPIAKGGNLTPVKAVVPEFVKVIKRNRATRTLDRIVCRNGKCIYECLWAQSDRGQWMCIYALDLYNWINLGDTKHFEARGCVGSYFRSQGGTPKDATITTRLIFQVDNKEPLDPFGE